MSRGLRSSLISHLSSLAAALLLLACGERPPATTQDDLGRDVALPRDVRRVVTLSPNLTEMVFAVGANDRLVGADDFSNFPIDARRLPKVGGMQPNLEKIVQLRPDLVLASTEGNHPSLAPALAAAKIPLFVIRTDRVAEIAPAMKRVGDLLHAPRTADAVRELEVAMENQRRQRPEKRRVLFAVWTDPLYVAGRETFTDDLFALTGAENAVNVKGWPQYSLESLVAAPPDLILYPRGAVTEQQVAALLKRAGLQTRVIAVHEDIFQRPGPRMPDAAASLNAILDLDAHRPGEHRPGESAAR
ncbi:MAG TPA: helical backbone metal receptor [Thermoanaerobaculia bacterium]|nr:helical backbone metal receptor [Thermoanaerobaculia bacterium]